MGSETGVLRQLFETAGPAITSVLSTAWSVASPLLDLAIQGVGLLADAFGAAFPYIQGIVESVWNVIGPVFSKIGEGIGVVTSAIKKIRGVDDGGGGSGGGAGGIVAANATGTPYFSGGWTTVGEHGPELMNLPAGTKILSNQTSKTVQQGGRKISINVEHMEVRSDADIQRVAEEFAKRLEEAEENQ